MGWGDAWLGGAGWFTGVVQGEPPGTPPVLPVSIGGRPYAVETTKYKRQTVPALRPSLDQAPEPGEVSLNNAGMWRRSQSDWRLGANQLMFDENDSKRQRYWTSKGLNPHPDTPANAYQMRLHKATQRAFTSGNANLKLIVAGTFMYMADGANLRFFNSAGSQTVTDATTVTGGAQIVGLATDGSYVYIACGAAGLYRIPIGVASSTVRFGADTQTVNMVAYVNGNLFGAAGPKLFQYNAAGQLNGDTVEDLTTLTATVTAGAVAALTVAPLPVAVPAAATVTVYFGGFVQSFTVAAGGAAVGATSIPLSGATAAHTYNANETLVVLGGLTAATGLLSYTHPNAGFVWGGMVSTPHGIFAYGSSGIAGEMYLLGVDTTTGAINAPQSMFILPDGESLNSIAYYSGAIILGTSAGIRVATVLISFVLSVTYGPVILIAGGVASVYGFGQWAWFAWTNYDQVSTGLGRLDLARFATDLTPAMSSDVLAGTSSSPVQGQVVSVVNFAGLAWFTVGGSGLWQEHPTNYVATGTVDVGRIKFGTTEKKLPLFVDLYHSPLPAGASIGVSTVDDFGTVTIGGVSAGQGTIHPAELLGLEVSMQAEQLELLITINNGTDLTSPPVLRRWTLYALVTPRRVDQIDCPIILASRVSATTAGGASDFYSDILAEFLFLKGLEAAGEPVVYSEGDLEELVYIQGVTLEGDRWAPNDHHYIEGTLTVSMITLGSVNG